MSSTSAAGIYAACITLPIISIAVIGARLWSRKRAKVQMRFDDWIQIPNLLLFLALSIVGLVGVSNHAFGYPDPPGDEEHTKPTTVLVQKCMYVMYIITSILLSLIKISALSFYRRVFCNHNNKILNFIIVTLMVIQVLWSVTFLVWVIAVCGSHPAYIWLGGEGFLQYCSKLAIPYDDAYAISDWILDVFVLLIPLPPIWRLRLPMAKKVAVSFAFMLALLGFGASTARLAIWLQLAYGSGGNVGAAGVDMQLADTQAFWFTLLETGCTLISVNLPSLWGHISRGFPEWYGSLRSWSDSVRVKVSRGSSSSRHGKISATDGYNSTERTDTMAKTELSSGSDISTTKSDVFVEHTQTHYTHSKEPWTYDEERG